MNKMIQSLAIMLTKNLRKSVGRLPRSTGRLPQLKNGVSAGLLTGVIFLSSALVHAQDANTAQWFQVEVIVFKRQQESYQEHWPTNITLGYPKNWVALQDPTAAIDEAPIDGVPAEETFPTAAPLETVNTTPDLEAAEATPLVDKLVNTPFLLLPDAEHQLSGHAAALRRNSRYEVLFHQAWRQPMSTPRAAPAVLINGGQQYDDHRELEGSITVSMSQFLQLKADLWLTQFEAIDDQRPSQWPILPPIPQVEAVPATTAASSPFTAAPSSEGATGIPGPGAFAADVLEAESLETEIPETESLEAEISATETLAQEREQWESSPLVFEAVDAYRPARIVCLQEERRIRARELHYLDHPLFGVIIQLTPYEIPAFTE